MDFWQATVPEFWAAVDWTVEKNLDQEDRYEDAKAQSQQQEQREISFKGGSAPINGRGIQPVINPNMNLKPNPEWQAWRDQLWRDHGV